MRFGSPSSLPSRLPASPPNSAGRALHALSFVESFGTLWFIYLLPIFFVVTKATRDVPPVMVWFVAALLQIAQIHTGSTVIDEFFSRFVYFYSGYILAPYVFQLAARVLANKSDAVLFLCAWALLEAVMVFGGYSELPVVGLGLAFLGAMAVVAVSTLLSTRDWASPLRYAGQNSIAVYLAFFLPITSSSELVFFAHCGRASRGSTCHRTSLRPCAKARLDAVQQWLR
jgi:uncharacterized membrane protein YcfT